jgi:protein-tyrosine phosphatase
MIDLHCHILPGIDDGAKSLDQSLDMARLAYADGTRLIACTPHVFPPSYPLDTAAISAHVAQLRRALEAHSIRLNLVIGGDVHLLPDLSDRLTSGQAPTLNGSRYFLLEPDHVIVPPNFVASIKSYLEIGFIPIITHPERLVWLPSHYDLFCEAEEAGAAVQITAGSVVGLFGKRARAWAERMLIEGRVDLIASDAHDDRHRPPGLSAAMATAESLIGATAARSLVFDNPLRILRNEPLPRKDRKLAAPARNRSSAWSFLKWLRDRNV